MKSPELETRFLKTYSDRPYRHTALVRHNGTLIALAMDAGRRIHYAVLDPAGEEPIDARNWPRSPRELNFPNEIVQVGFGVLPPRALPLVDRAGRPLTGALDPQRLDRFASTTAGLTADAPFQVVSDEKHVLIFRQAIGADHPDQIQVDSESGPVPVAADTLLVDRFLLVDGALVPAREVRFRRSRNRSRPQDSKDTLGAADMNGLPFFEPTRELDFVRHLQGGRFTVLLLPSQVADVKRWQIFAHNARSGRIDSFNIQRSGDGLFSPRGAESAPGSEDGDGSAARHHHFGESALALTGDDHLELTAPALRAAGWSLALWLKPRGPGSLYRQGALQLELDDQNRLVATLGEQSVSSDPEAIVMDRWNRISLTRQEGRVRLTWDAGQTEGQWDTDSVAAGTARIGEGFTGVLDEFQLWERPLASFEERRTDRLVGDEPGLGCYLRLDEALGTLAHDQTDHLRHATLRGEPQWVASDAPLRDQPGIRRSSFAFEGRAPASGLTALLYHQQEQAASGQDGMAKPFKRAARVLLAVTTEAPGESRRQVAALDFAVNRDGRLAQVPDLIALPTLSAGETEPGQQIQAVVNLEERLKVLGLALEQLQGEREQVRSRLTDLEARHQQKLSERTALHRRRAHFHSIYGPSGNSQFSLTVGTFSNFAQGTHNDQVYLVRLDPGVRITLYEHYYRQGLNITLNAAQTDLRRLYTADGRTWRQLASGAQVSLEPGLAEALDREIRTLTEQINGQRARLTELDEAIRHKLHLIEATDQERVRARDRLRGEVALPLALLHIDPQGMSVRGGLLAFAWSDDTPALFDSAVGRIALYFRGGDGQLFASYYDISAARAMLALPGNALALTARAPGEELGATRVTVAPGVEAGSCTLTLHNPVLEVTETWRHAPRDAVALAALLNGRAGQSAYLGRLAKALEPGAETVELDGPLVQGYGIGAALVLPDGSRLAPNGPARPGDAILSLAPQEIGESWPAGTPVQVIPYHYAAHAATDRPAYDPAQGSLLVNALGVEGSVADTPAEGLELEGPALSPRWVSDPPGRALKLDGASPLVAERNPDNLRARGDLTLEAWLRPSQIQGRVWAVSHGDSPYGLGLEAADLPSALHFDGNDRLQIDGLDLADRSFTIEFWARRTRTRTIDLLVGCGQVQAPRRLLHIGFLADDRFSLGFWDDDLDTPPYPDQHWHHWACTFDRENRRQAIYRDGILAAERTATGPLQTGGPLWLGFGYGSLHFRGAMDEVRVWDHARSPEQIRDHLQRRLDGPRPGLLGHWQFADRDSRDRSGQGRHARIHGNPALTASWLPGYRVVAGSNNTFARSRAILPARQWTHLAAGYDQAFALALDGRDDYLDAGNSQALNLGTDLTLEVTVRLTALGSDQGILAKGVLSGGDPDQQAPYALTADGSGRLVFAFEDQEGRQHHLATPAGKLVAGRSQRLAVTREKRIDSQAASNLDLESLTQLGGDLSALTLPGGIQEWLEVALYIDGRREAFARLPAVTPATGDRPLEIGRVQRGGRSLHLQGAVSQVRLWSEALAPGELGRNPDNRRGLVAWWTLGEGNGAVAADRVGGHDAALQGARWIRDPDPAASRLVIRANGLPLELEPVAVPDLAAGFAVGRGFEGEIDELRLWNSARSEENLLDNLFGHLKGERDELLAYYPFDRDQEGDGFRVLDNALEGHHLVAADQAPSHGFSTAPLGEDIPRIRNALAGVRTPWQGPVASRPAVAEYGDLQYRANGELAGALKRCYAYIDDGNWQLVSGHKVGNVVSEWLSQVQFDPQVMGYIEGAPPVPGENLTEGAGDDFRGAAGIELQEAQEVSYAIASSREGSFDTSLDFSASVGVDFSSDMVCAPLGFGVLVKASQIQVGARVSGGLETAQGWSSSESRGRGRNTRQNTRVNLAGHWEDPQRPEIPAAREVLGRRFLPANTGFAVVESATADVYALRLAHNGALLALRFAPNPDIPRDTNLISFPINPTYTKQGTLDGGVGFGPQGKILDPHWPNALGRGEYSYFRPREAYALRNRLQRERQRLEAFYENYAPVANVGNAAQAGLSVIDQAVGGDTARTLAATALPPGSRDGHAGAYAKRNLVNSYLWTADGGFRSESSETTLVRQETVGAGYSRTDRVGGGLSLGFNVFGADVGFELDLAFAGSLSETRSVGRDAQASFGLEISLDLPGDLQARDEAGNPLFDGQGRPVPAPGKVDAYRFHTFSLEPAPAHFDALFAQVVDPLWLAQSDHPAARALRGARNNSRRPPCWRVFHRVTFVSRILPRFPDTTMPPMEQALRSVDIDSNWLLIQRLDPFVREHAGDLGTLSAAAGNAVRRHLPELEPYLPEIIEYLADYYGLEV